MVKALNIFWPVVAVAFCLSTLWLSNQLQVLSEKCITVADPEVPGGTVRGVRSIGRADAAPEEKITIAIISHFEDFSRLFICIASLRLHMPLWAAHEALIVVPYEESQILPHVLTHKPGSWPIRVLAEHDVLGLKYEEMQKMPDFTHKYKLQMMLKLFVSRHVVTDFYLVLDSDVVMLQPLQTIRWLFPEPGRAVYHQEHRSVHEEWWQNTETYLQLDGCLSKDPDTPTFGVTPALLSKAIAEKTLSHIFHVFGYEPRDWFPALMSHQQPLWTEYTAYRLAACRYGMFEEYHKERRAHTHTPHLYNGCWTKESTLNRTIRPADRSLFLVVQSSTQVPVRKVVKDLSEVFTIA